VNDNILKHRGTGEAGYFGRKLRGIFKDERPHDAFAFQRFQIQKSFRAEDREHNGEMKKARRMLIRASIV
jgi:hypothetical protein